MRQYLLLGLTTTLLAAMLLGCGETPKDSPNVDDSVASEGLTKVFEYAVDAGGMFHTDLNDEDFSDVAQIMEQLIADVLNGKLKAHDPLSEEPLSVEDVRKLLIATDTVFVEHPETGEMTAETVVRDHSKGFHSVKFREQWKYAPEGDIIERKVLAIAPRIPVYSSMGGELRGYTSLFVVKLE